MDSMRTEIAALSENRIIRKMFRKAELSYAVSDFSKAIGPIIDLAFISQFIGPDGVAVMGYVAPLIMLFELITEELSGVFAEHGFADGRRHNINMRLVAKDEDLIIRLRDDCRPFNVTEYYQLVRGLQDREKEIGLTIIMQLAEEVKYTATFGANNLIVRI